MCAPRGEEGKCLDLQICLRSVPRPGRSETKIPKPPRDMERCRVPGRFGFQVSFCLVGWLFLPHFKWGWHILASEGWQVVLNVTSSGHGSPLCSSGDGEVALAWLGSLGTPTGLGVAADPWYPAPTRALGGSPGSLGRVGALCLLDPSPGLRHGGSDLPGNSVTCRPSSA